MASPDHPASPSSFVRLFPDRHHSTFTTASACLIVCSLPWSLSVFRPALYCSRSRDLACSSLCCVQRALHRLHPRDVLHKYFLKLFFNWRNIALQCCVGFCHTTAQFSCNYTYITCLLSLPALLPSLWVITEHQTGLLVFCNSFYQLSVLHILVDLC